MKITLKAARINSGMTLKQVSEVIRCSVASLSYWENGKADITAVNLARLCALYDINMDDVILAHEKNFPNDSLLEKGVVK